MGAGWGPGCRCGGPWWRRFFGWFWGGGCRRGSAGAVWRQVPRLGRPLWRALRLRRRCGAESLRRGACSGGLAGGARRVVCAVALLFGVWLGCGGLSCLAGLLAYRLRRAVWQLWAAGLVCLPGRRWVVRGGPRAWSRRRSVRRAPVWAPALAGLGGAQGPAVSALLLAGCWLASGSVARARRVVRRRGPSVSAGGARWLVLPLWLACLPPPCAPCGSSGLLWARRSGRRWAAPPCRLPLLLFVAAAGCLGPVVGAQVGCAAVPVAGGGAPSACGLFGGCQLCRRLTCREATLCVRSQQE